MTRESKIKHLNHSLPSPPLVPITDEEDDTKISIEHWHRFKDVEPITTESDTFHLSIEQVIPQSDCSKKIIDDLSKEIETDVSNEKNKICKMVEGENLGMELKRKLSLESMNVEEQAFRVKEKRCNTSLTPPQSETCDILKEKEQEMKVGHGRHGRVIKKGGQAVKMALNDLESKKALEREARILENLSHPNIVEFYAFKGHKLYMELADSTFAQKCEQLDVRRVARELFKALTYLHDKGIIHGDLKPSNLLQKDGTLLICDFGQSKYEYEAYTSVGTTAYVAPECLQLIPTQSFKSDIYSAGACLYYLMTGRDPFQQYATKSSVQMIIRIRAGFFNAERVEMDHINPLKHNDSQLVDLVKRCTNKDASQRPSAKEAFDTLLNEE